MKNRQKKRSIAALSAIVALSSVLAACGSNTSNDGNGGSDSGKPVTLKVMSSTIVEKPAGEIEQELADEFMKANPDIKIEFMGLSQNDAFAKITTLATGNQLPDIFLNTSDFYATANGMGITADLTPLLGEDFVKGFYPSVLKESTIDGKLQYMPWFTTPIALIYRTDWFEAEGLKPPVTWDDFVKSAQKLTKDTDGDGKADQWGFGLVGTNNSSGTYRFLPILHSFGASELKQDADGKWVTDLDSPEAIEAFQFFGDLANKYKVTPPGAMQNAYAENVTLMANDKIGMVISGSHSIAGLIEKNPKLEGKLAAVPVPKKTEHSSNLSAFGFSISEKSSNKEAAAKYLKFLVEKENAIKFFEGTGRMPTRMEAGDDARVQSPVYKGFLDAQQYAVPQPVVSFFSQVQSAVGTAYQAMLAGSTKAETAATKAAESVRSEIERNQ
ncbi:ABC transporter substrate-binding protein [Paenibacillus nasutitermitis]|uniref:Sugar-binding protein n=1 Tax=Paenibacillus nasutitermitis TaxID=1652958 RepID=A0A916Z541_9BACL|nr:sugar ABC transporter substrate-binding protein [Paenibacillus nasutitermitis]GGD76974.1 sugar-binding protein [Paenibacillus nasutitermitis]